LEAVREMAEDGLRTLCLGGRELAQAEWEEWNARYQEAASSVTNRQEKIDECAEELERNLNLHGITGIEDRLQTGVTETIMAMIKAGIKVWMLTGDKVETAINIGIATGLLDPDSAEDKGERRILTAQDFTIDGAFNAKQFDSQLAQLATEAKTALESGTVYEGLVIDGRCLEEALKAQNDESFVDICKVCRTVLCCRVSPKQKGAVVRLMKKHVQAVTLAIGDGANDCNMIQSADVGIGIRGLEGLQAFNVCDYGISQFRFLQNLLLVHGRWCYRRMAILVNYTFYKNVVVVMAQYFLGSVSAFSGQKLYHDAFYQVYNVIHSTLPIVVFAILDQDVGKTVSLKNPALYRLGHLNTYLNRWVAASWLIRGFFHAAIAFWLPYYTMSNGQFTHSDGKANDVWMLGVVVYLLVVVIVNMVILLESCFWNWMLYLSIGCSLLAWCMEQGWLSGYFTGSAVTIELWGTTQRLISSPTILLVCLTVITICLLAEAHLKGLHRTFAPNILHYIQDKVVNEETAKRRPEAGGKTAEEQIPKSVRT
jgi:phospholipid-translocating ATPase